MNKGIFLDTSAIFKEYHDEKGSDTLHAFFNQARDRMVVLCISVTYYQRDAECFRQDPKNRIISQILIARL